VCENSFGTEPNVQKAYSGAWRSGFGYGAHLCLGAPQARMEAQSVLRELVTRVSRISASTETTWSTNSSLRGPTHLLIRLTPA
jgi:cytochrome P450